MQTDGLFKREIYNIFDTGKVFEPATYWLLCQILPVLQVLHTG